MKLFKKKILVIFLTGLVISSIGKITLTAADSGASSKSSFDLFPDEVVAKGNGVEVKRSQIEEAFILVKANLMAGTPYIPEERRKVLEAKLLDRLIATQLLLSKATDEDRKNAEQAANKFIEEAKSRFVSEQLFNLNLRANGLTFEKFKTRVLEQSICDEVVKREVKKDVVITKEQIKKFYDENPEEFTLPERRKILHILIATKDMNDPAPQLRLKRDLPEDAKLEKRKLAESVLARAKRGDDFVKLVKEYSEDYQSKERGGEYVITRAKDDPRAALMPELEIAAFSTNQGEVSNLITSPYGYHIVKVVEVMPAGKRPLSEVEEEIKKYLEQEEVQKLLPGYFEKLKKEAKVEILDPELKEIQEQLSKSKNKTM
jgi:parvulin-like peptidyl-prolyl isomerase